MGKKITMGNDEFILYIRKNYYCSLTNDRLGKLILEWILENSKGIDKEKDIEYNLTCYWDTSRKAKNIYKTQLPKTAAQISFNRNLLPKLYDYLDELAATYKSTEPWYELRKREEETDEHLMPELEF